MRIGPVGAELFHADRGTDGHFSQFCESAWKAAAESIKDGGHPAWVLGEGLTTPHLKNSKCYELKQEASHRYRSFGMTSRIRSKAIGLDWSVLR